jgi:hypothetical protein
MKTTIPQKEIQPGIHKRSGFFTRTKGYPALIMGLACTALIGGILFTTLSIAGFIQPLFLSGLSSMLGSLLIMLGSFVLFEEIRSQKDRGKLISDALNRILKDRN